jgi:hypothetical protein
VSPAVRALRSDVVRRAASRGGTLRCAEARRVADRDAKPEDHMTLFNKVFSTRTLLRISRRDESIERAL